MRIRLKPLSEQVMVITGASSGIGLTTARAAADAGAKIVLSSRDHRVLEALVRDLAARGGDAIAVPADVADLGAVRRIATRTIELWGRIDTWVNNAGVSIYGTLMETPEEDHRRLFDTNYWGVVNGSRVAVEHLRERGGALINVGSVLGDRAVPLQGAYSASKHAVRGFTDALRMELEHDRLPIAVTLIKPSSIATPYHEHARNYTAHEPRNPRPVYAPNLVARAILRAATEPVRELAVGGGGRMLSALGAIAPRTLDRVMDRTLIDGEQQQKRLAAPRRDNLYAPADDGRERGHYPTRVLERSFADRVSERRGSYLAAGALVTVGLALLIRRL